MSRRDRKKAKRPATTASQRMNRLKAKALTQVAGQAWAYNQRHKTIALLTEALRREPASPEIILKLADAYGRQRYYEKAHQLLVRLLELAPRKAKYCHQAARTYAAVDRPDEAIACYRRCLELYQDKAARIPALVELAAIYERRRQLDDARAAVAEALQQDPNHEEALLQQALLDRRHGEPDRAEATLRQLAGDRARGDAVRAQAWYELAALLDKAEQYDEAFGALLAAKELVKPHAGPHRRDYQMTLDKNRELVAELDQAHYDKWKAAAEHDSPYRFAVLTGHPRSGTTLIEQVLDSHDQAKSADEFDVVTHWIYLPIVTRFPLSMSLLSILDRVPDAVRQEARATYWRQTEAIFNEPLGERLLIDKNPALTMILPVMNWAFPEMKMLIALRDPRDVILSCFMQRLQPNPISVNWLSIDAAADFYAQNMKTWLAVRRFTEGSWLEFRYEDVVADLPQHARRILDFLGLPWDDKVLKFYEHAASKVVRSPTYQDVTRPIYQGSVGRWQHYAKHLEPVFEKLQPYIKEFGYA